MKLLGDSMSPLVWDVKGNSCSLRDYVSRQTYRKANVDEAKGRPSPSLISSDKQSIE